MSLAVRIDDRDAAPLEATAAGVAAFVEAIDFVTLYAQRVVAGEIVNGLYVRQACERHLRDLKDAPARGLRFSWPVAKHALDFFPRFLRHSKGEWRRRPLDLGMWQVFGLGCFFGWQRRNTSALLGATSLTPARPWLRRFKTAWLEVPKKNGKSTTLGGVGLYALTADQEPGAEVYAAATKRDQARLVFDEARQMVLSSPALRSLVRVLKHNLHVEESYSKFEPISSDATTGDGINPHCAILDEVHRLKTRALLTVLDQGTGARLQPMIWAITTAGDTSPNTPYDELHEHARKVLDGAVDDDAFFALIFSADEADDPFDVATWIKANPNYEISVKHHDLVASAAQARSSPQALADFKRFRLNIRSSDADAAIKMEVWKRNHVPGARLDLDALRGRQCFAAVDLSSKIDLSCVLLLFPPLDPEARAGRCRPADNDRWLLVPFFWCPSEGIRARGGRDKVPYERWAKEGFLTPTLGNVVDYHAIRQALTGYTDLDGSAIEGAKQMFRVFDVAFDPWNAGTLISDVAQAGMMPIEFRQGTASYAHPTKEFLGMLLDGCFEHFDNPILKFMASSLRLVRDHNDNPMPSKLKSTSRIDGVVCAIMALARALDNNGNEGLEAAILRRGGLITAG